MDLGQKYVTRKFKLRLAIPDYLEETTDSNSPVMAIAVAKSTIETAFILFFIRRYFPHCVCLRYTALFYPGRGGALYVRKDGVVGSSKRRFLSEVGTRDAGQQARRLRVDRRRPKYNMYTYEASKADVCMRTLRVKQSRSCRLISQMLSQNMLKH